MKLFPLALLTATSALSALSAAPTAAADFWLDLVDG